MNTKLLSAILIASTAFGYAQTTVTSSVTGEEWMDRNLGATQVATSLTDIDGVGDLYQWGRATDGHQLRTATVVSGQIVAGSEGAIFYYDEFAGNWLMEADDLRWQATDVINNPCPTGFRIPTSEEFIAEGYTDGASAFASELKLPYTGYRSNGDGNIYNTDTQGVYWTSNVSGINAIHKFYDATSTNDWTDWRASGLAVRCIREKTTASVNNVLLLGFNMYPNPASIGTKINYEVSSVVKNVQISIYDVTGKEVHKQEDASKIISLSGVSEGIYLVKFVLDNETTIVKELIIK